MTFPQARQAMQEQLARNKELTQKVRAASESEEEGEGQEEEEEPLVPDLVNGVQIKANGLNPWMFRNHFIDAKEAEVQKDLEDPAEPEAQETSESEEEKAVVEEETLLKEFEERRSLRQKSELSHMAEPVHRRVTKGEQWYTTGGAAWCWCWCSWPTEENCACPPALQRLGSRAFQESAMGP